MRSDYTVPMAAVCPFLDNCRNQAISCFDRMMSEMDFSPTICAYHSSDDPARDRVARDTFRVAD